MAIVVLLVLVVVLCCRRSIGWNLFAGKHVVFGKVTDGMDVVKKISFKGSEVGKPKAEVKIVDCGSL